MKYAWMNAEKKRMIRETVTEEWEQTFTLEDLSREWTNRKAALVGAQADIVAFREKVVALCTDLKIEKKDLVGMDDLDVFGG